MCESPSFTALLLIIASLNLLKTYQFHLELRRHEHILRPQIPVNHRRLQTMQVIQGLRQFEQDLGLMAIFEAFLASYVIIQSFVKTHILSYHINIVQIVQSNGQKETDIRVSESL